MVYTNDLTDKEWQIIEPLLPQKKKTRPVKWTKREILDGIFYRLKNGCNWVDLPKDLLSYSTVFWHYKQRGAEGILESIMTELHAQTREQVKKTKWTTLIIVDSQATKNTCNASVDSKGFCSYKATNGIKRHLAIDSLGLPFFTLCTKASVSDDRGLIDMFEQNMDYFKTEPVNIPKITIMVDRGYNPEYLSYGTREDLSTDLTLTKLDLHNLADLLLLDDPNAIEVCIQFVEANTEGIWHGRARAMMCRRLKHCTLCPKQRQRLVFCLAERLHSGHFSEQFKDQLRLALHLDVPTTLAVALACRADSRNYVRRYAEWILAHHSNTINTCPKLGTNS